MDYIDKITAYDGDGGSTIFKNHLDRSFYKVSKDKLENFKPWDLIDMFNGKAPNPDTFKKVSRPNLNSDVKLTYYRPYGDKPDKICFTIHRYEELAMVIPYCQFCKSRPTVVYTSKRDDFLVCDEHEIELNERLSSKLA